MKKITAIILETRDEFVERGYATSYQDINRGSCIYFSEIVQDKLSGMCDFLNSDCFLDDGWNGDGEDRWEEEFLLSYNSMPPNDLTVYDLNNMIFGYHQWIYYKGKHYDAEAPNGVDNFFDLPFYKRKFVENKKLDSF